MGVDRKDYIVYGWKLPPDYFKQKGVDLWDDKFLPYTEGHKGVKYTIIRDGMSGQYDVFGLLITQADEAEGFEFYELSQDTLAYPSVEIVAKFEEVFGFKDKEIGWPKFLVFTHWSLPAKKENMNNEPKILHLTLKKKWFDMIASGEKKEEYREVKPYWWKRLVQCGEWNDSNNPADWICILPKRYDAIIFSNGYKGDSPKIKVQCKSIFISMFGTEKWGFEEGKRTFVIELGQIIPIS